MTQRLAAAGALLLVYLLVRAFWMAPEPHLRVFDYAWAEGLLKVALWVAPAVVLTMAVERVGAGGAWQALGLRGGAGRGLGFGLLVTVPMAVVLPFGALDLPTLDVLVGAVLLGPFAEEVLFRGFLMGRLRRAGLRPALAIGISAAAFGLAHVQHSDLLLVRVLVTPVLGGWQGSFLDQAVGQMVVTAGGGALFGWIVYRWGSLWPAIGLHACINLWWSLGGAGADVPTAPEAALLSVGHAIAALAAVAITMRRDADYSSRRTSRLGDLKLRD
jgi:membrane protease YdiL (CAAX protease family)